MSANLVIDNGKFEVTQTNNPNVSLLHQKSP